MKPREIASFAVAVLSEGKRRPLTLRLEHVGTLRPLDGDWDAEWEPGQAPAVAHREHVEAHRDSGLHRHPPAVKATPAHKEPADGLGGGERKILTAVAQHGAEGVTREHLSILTGFKKSYRDKVIRFLKRDALIDDRDGHIIATPAGMKSLGDGFQALPTGADLLDHWRRTLPGGERQILDAAVASYPGPVSRDEISDVTGFKKSYRDKVIRFLKSRKLISDSGRGAVVASDLLFDWDRRQSAGAK